MGREQNGRAPPAPIETHTTGTVKIIYRSLLHQWGVGANAVKPRWMGFRTEMAGRGRGGGMGLVLNVRGHKVSLLEV